MTLRQWSSDSIVVKKTLCPLCSRSWRSFYDRKIRQVRDLSAGDKRVYLELEVRRLWCRRCQKVRQERVKFLADNPFYTKRFALYIGKRCRSSSIRDVAKEFRLDWKTVKDLDKEYMRQLLAKASKAAPRVIGLDEVSIRKGHSYRIVVSDLERHRVIWFGGKDRSEATMDEFYNKIRVIQRGAYGLRDEEYLRLKILTSTLDDL